MVMIGKQAPEAADSDKERASMREWEMHELAISRGAAIILAFLYVAYLVFQLKTHTEQFAAEGDGEEVDIDMSLVCAILVLIVATGLVAICSECLVHSVEGM